MKPAAEKPRVLFLPKWFPNRLDPLQGIFVARHAEAIAPHAQIAVLFSAPDATVTGWKPQWEWEDTPTYLALRAYYPKRFTGIGPIDKVLKLLFVVLCYAKGYQLLKQSWGKPELVHAHVLLRTGVFAWLLKNVSGIPYLITEHWSGYLAVSGSYRGSFRKWLTGLIANDACAITTVSTSLRDAMLGHGLQNQYEVIPNAVDTSLFTIQDQSKPEGRRILLHVAEFQDWVKNTSGILRAIKQLSLLRNDFRLNLVGYGESEPMLKKLAAELGILDKQAFFLGPKTGAELAQHFRESTAFVLFSHYETQAIVLIESLLSGVPVAATNVGGIPEVVGENGGILVEPGNEAQLVKAMEQMLDHSSEYAPEELRQSAVERFSKEAVGTRFAALYRECLSGKTIATTNRAFSQ